MLPSVSRLYPPKRGRPKAILSERGNVRPQAATFPRLRLQHVRRLPQWSDGGTAMPVCSQRDEWESALGADAGGKRRIFNEPGASLRSIKLDASHSVATKAEIQNIVCMPQYADVLLTTEIIQKPSNRSI